MARPTTANRPGTSSNARPNRPMTARTDGTYDDGEDYDDGYDDDEGDDEDEGMFSFAPPPPGSTPVPTSPAYAVSMHSAGALAHHQQPSYASSYGSQMVLSPAAPPYGEPARSPPPPFQSPAPPFHTAAPLFSTPSYPDPVAHSRSASNNSTTPLSPAAAYAAQQQQSLHQAPPPGFTTTTPIKRRSGFQYPESPTYSPRHRQPQDWVPQGGQYGYTPDGTPVIELTDRRPSQRSLRPGPASDDLCAEDDEDADSLSPSGFAPEKLGGMGVGGGVESLNGLGGELDEEEDSPYPEVCASVSNIDDPEMPCITFRSLTIGLLLCTVCGSMNFFFSLRYPSAFISSILIQIISYPLGKLCARVLPVASVALPNWFCRAFSISPGTRWSLNPGPFNIKEHCIIILMANTSLSPAYAVTTTLIFNRFFGIPLSVGFDVLLVTSVQVLGFALAGICRRFLVWPASLIWPQNLVTCTLLNTFHAEEDDQADGSMTRFRFFGLVAAGAFLWYFLPGPFRKLVGNVFGCVCD
jgi:hypothetical protein